MTLLTSDDRVFLESVAKLNYVNPFLPERIDCERRALGSEFDESKANWNLLGDDPEFQQVNTAKIMERAYEVITRVNKQLRDGGQATPGEMELYEDTGLSAPHGAARILLQHRRLCYPHYSYEKLINGGVK